MTCAETRDLFSALADDALSPAERAGLDAHLAGCAECRRELASLLRTVKMVRALDPAHAPAGFVDRVLAAAEPTPWPRRVAQRLGRPWPALPLSAAALLLVGGLAVLLFRASPQQQRAARYEPPPAPPATAPSTPAPAADALRAPGPATSAPPSSAAPTTAPRSSMSPSGATAEQGARKTEQGARKTSGASSKSPAPSDARRERDDQAAAPSAPAASAERAAAARPADKSPDAAAIAAARQTTEQRVTVAKPAERAQAKADVSERAERKDEAGAVAKEMRDANTAPTAQSAPLSRTGPMTGMPAAPPDVTADLRTANVSAAERSLIDLATRVGGRQIGRRIAGGRVIVELAVPRDAYAEFVRSVAALGPVAIQSQATERPVLSIAIAVSS